MRTGDEQETHWQHITNGIESPAKVSGVWIWSFELGEEAWLAQNLCVIILGDHGLKDVNKGLTQHCIQTDSLEKTLSWPLNSFPSLKKNHNSKYMKCHASSINKIFMFYAEKKRKWAKNRSELFICFISVYQVPTPLQVLLNFFFFSTTNLPSRNYDPHINDVDPELQMGWVTCLRSHSNKN